MSAILDFMGPIIGSLKSPCTASCGSSLEIIALNCLVFEKIAFWHQDPSSAILDFRGPVMGSLKRPCAISYRSSIDTIALNCLVFEKIVFFCILSTDRQTDGQTDRQTDGQLRCTQPLI